MTNIKTKFVELLEKSTITQSYITIAVVTVACVLWGLQVEIPESLQTIIIVVIGYFFGQKSASMRNKGE